jgi:tRNA (guanine-N7-)-methyltransferase
MEIMERKIADSSVAAVLLFFPDPWQKNKHHKRRIVRPEFIELVVKKLQSGGYFHAATDWKNYAESMLAVLSVARDLRNTSSTQNYSERPDYRPMTKFEQRGLRLGHGVWDLIFQKS